MEVLKKLKEQGWYLTEEGLKKITDAETPGADVRKIMAAALNWDFREIAGGALPNKREESLPGRIVLQIQKIRNISAPKANEESKTAPRMLQVDFSDGQTLLQGLELEPISALSLNVAPGTKVYLKSDRLQLMQGFAVLKAAEVEVLGGRVEQLAEKWELTRTMLKYALSGRRISGSSGPPPWIAFGKKLEVKDSLTAKNFKSLQLAADKDKDGSKENEEFKAMRTEAIAEAAKAGNKKVFGGGNQQILDHNVKKILEKGYSEEDAKNALRSVHNNLERALYNLKRRDDYKRGEDKSRNSAESTAPSTGRFGRGGGAAAREYVGKRGLASAKEEAAAAKPASNVSLFEFLTEKLPAEPVATTSTAATSSSAAHYNSSSNQHNKFEKSKSDVTKTSYGGKPAANDATTAATRAKFENNISSSFAANRTPAASRSGGRSDRDREPHNGTERQSNTRYTGGRCGGRGGYQGGNTRGQYEDGGNRGYQQQPRREGGGSERHTSSNNNNNTRNNRGSNERTTASSATSQSASNEKNKTAATPFEKGCVQESLNKTNEKVETKPYRNPFRTEPKDHSSNYQNNNNRYNNGNNYTNNRQQSNYTGDKNKTASSTTNNTNNNTSHNNNTSKLNSVEHTANMNKLVESTSKLKIDKPRAERGRNEQRQQNQRQQHQQQQQQQRQQQHQQKQQQKQEHQQRQQQQQPMPATITPQQQHQQQILAMNQAQANYNQQQLANGFSYDPSKIIGFQSKETNEFAMTLLKSQGMTAATATTSAQPEEPTSATHYIPNTAVLPPSQQPATAYGAKPAAFVLPTVQSVAAPPTNNSNYGMMQPCDSWMWKIGDLCLAKYWDDGMYYEAEITGVSDKTCVVFFRGYGNHEEVLQSDCLPITDAHHRPINQYNASQQQQLAAAMQQGPPPPLSHSAQSRGGVPNRYRGERQVYVPPPKREN